MERKMLADYKKEELSEEIYRKIVVLKERDAEFSASAVKQKEIFDYLHSLPLNIDVEVNGKSYILVHGGAIAHYDRYAFKYDTQEEYAVWNRIHYKAPDIESKTIIFGHTPTSEYQHNNPLEIWHSPSGGKIGIDCGCGFPHSLSQGRYPAFGRLACLRLDDMKVFYSEEGIPEEVKEVVW